MSRLDERPSPDASTLRPPRMTCTCGGEVDFDRGFIGSMESGIDCVALSLANCSHCKTTRAIEVFSVVRRGYLAGLK